MFSSLGELLTGWFDLCCPSRLLAAVSRPVFLSCPFPFFSPLSLVRAPLLLSAPSVPVFLCLFSACSCLCCFFVFCRALDIEALKRLWSCACSYCIPSTWTHVMLEVLATSHIVISTAPQAQQNGLSQPGAAGSPCGPDTTALPYNTGTVPQSTPLHPP